MLKQLQIVGNSNCYVAKLSFALFTKNWVKKNRQNISKLGKWCQNSELQLYRQWFGSPLSWSVKGKNTLRLGHLCPSPVVCYGAAAVKLL